MKSFNYIFILVIFLSACQSTAHVGSGATVLNQTGIDRGGNAMLIGKCNLAAFQQTPFNTYFDKHFAEYNIDSAAAIALKPLLANKKITVFLGSWCGDSKREVPHFNKLMAFLQVPESQIDYVFVNNSIDQFKKSPQHEERGRQIFRVPTFIVEENGQERGRIVEYPVVSLEKDLTNICVGESYEPHYKASRFFLNTVLPQPNFDADSSWVNTLRMAVKTDTFELNGLAGYLLYNKEKKAAFWLMDKQLQWFANQTYVQSFAASLYKRTGHTSLAKKHAQMALALDAKNQVAVDLLAELTKNR
jgi:thiol-disulfide isomerase/thioredoxin